MNGWVSGWGFSNVEIGFVILKLLNMFYGF
jgi:hypothetical protein